MVYLFSGFFAQRVRIERRLPNQARVLSTIQRLVGKTIIKIRTHDSERRIMASRHSGSPICWINPIHHQFSYIPCHIQYPIRAGAIRVAAPRIDAPARAARGFLPFRLCGQPAPGPPIQGKGHETDREMMAKGNQRRNVPAFVFKNE